MSRHEHASLLCGSCGLAGGLRGNVARVEATALLQAHSQRQLVQLGVGEAGELRKDAQHHPRLAHPDSGQHGACDARSRGDEKGDQEPRAALTNLG